MRFRTLACDYDGTLARDGRVDLPVLASLERVRASGRKLVLITGRQVGDLLEVFPRVELFDRVVAENGAVLFSPSGCRARDLGAAPPERLVDTLRSRGVEPLSVGRVIVATLQPQEATVLEVIRELGLSLRVIRNKGAVMVLPPGVTKATGLEAALLDLGVSAVATAGIGDAENDLDFLGGCGCSVAVANALPIVKESADVVTRGEYGAGVVELIDRLLVDECCHPERSEGSSSRVSGTRK